MQGPSNSDLLLISNSKTLKDQRFLAYCEDYIKAFFGDIKEILFIAYAEPSAIDGMVLGKMKAAGRELRMPTPLERMNAYTGYIADRLKEMGYKVVGIHETESPIEAVKQAKAVFIGGGNTGDLLTQLYAQALVYHLKERIHQGMKYLGVSAGTVMAGMNIATSNDNYKPVPTLDALEAVPFCIKPHYKDPLVITAEQYEAHAKISQAHADELAHQGETHRDRIMEFHHDFPYVALGMQEGSMLRVQGDHAQLLGSGIARVFRYEDFVRKYEPAELYHPGDSLDSIMVDVVPAVRTADVLRRKMRGSGSW